MRLRALSASLRDLRANTWCRITSKAEIRHFCATLGDSREPGFSHKKYRPEQNSGDPGLTLILKHLSGGCTGQTNPEVATGEPFQLQRAHLSIKSFASRGALQGDPPTFGVFPVCEQDDPEKPGCSGFVPFLFSVWFLRPCRAAAGLGVRLHQEHLRNKIGEDVERERASTMNIDDLSTAMSKTSAPQTYGNASAFPGLVGVGGIVTPCK